jgi:hypothetical protein
MSRVLSDCIVPGRLDLSTAVVHWTKEQRKWVTPPGKRIGGGWQPVSTAFECLQQILAENTIKVGSGCIKGGGKAVCFSEAPLPAMVEAFRLAERDASVKRCLKWEPYGLVFDKQLVYCRFGARPVLYLSDAEYEQLKVAGFKDHWRVVELDYNARPNPIDWTHEREWRSPADILLNQLDPDDRPCILVKEQSERDELVRLYPQAENRPFREVVVLGV